MTIINLIPVGAPCPGFGKTFLTAGTDAIFAANDKKCIRLSQDDCGGDRREFEKRLESEVHKAIREKYDVVILLDKWNGHENRQLYQTLAVRYAEVRLYWVGIESEQSKSVWIARSLERIRARGDNHPALRSKDFTTAKLYSILSNMAGKWTRPTEAELKEHYKGACTLSMEASKKEILGMFISFLRENGIADFSYEDADYIVANKSVAEYEKKVSKQSVIKRNEPVSTRGRRY